MLYDVETWSISNSSSLKEQRTAKFVLISERIFYRQMYKVVNKHIVTHSRMRIFISRSRIELISALCDSEYVFTHIFFRIYTCRLYSIILQRVIQVLRNLIAWNFLPSRLLPSFFEHLRIFPNEAQFRKNDTCSFSMTYWCGIVAWEGTIAQ